MKTKILILCLLAACAYAADPIPPTQDLTDKSIEISCTIQGTPPFTYQWYRGTATAPLKVKLEGETRSTITLTPPYVAGLYRCEVSNSAGKITTRPFKVSVTTTTSAPDLAVTVRKL